MFIAEHYGTDESRRQASISKEVDSSGYPFAVVFIRRGRSKTLVTKKRYLRITHARDAVKEFRKS